LLQIKQQVELKALSTMAVSAKAARLVELNSVDAIKQGMGQIQAEANKLIVGGGSNILFVGDYDGLILYPQLFGIEVVSQTDEQIRVSVGASENWHQWVQHANQQGWYGLENLALIPGTVGASPVQNIGAYGVEVKQFIHLVECFDLTTGELKVFDNASCEFAYRDSAFKQAGQGCYLVTRVEFNLLKQPQLILSYKPLADFFADKVNVSAKQVLDKVCQIRSEKLPDPNVLPNCGSFFKNPVISQQQFEQLQQRFSNIVAYPTDNGVKLAAGWLIDNAGYKGKRVGNIGVHQHQALVLVNYGESDGSKIKALAEEIQQLVLQKYDVMLEAEVRMEGMVNLERITKKA
jgi:UDP-N-acetylmuramate dehydrogenase